MDRPPPVIIPLEVPERDIVRGQVGYEIIGRHGCRSEELGEERLSGH